MTFDIYDYRSDVRNVVITPEIRARFFRLEPGEVASRHSHDLGHEVFLILEGQAEFEIEGSRAVLGPGQMCFARANEMHQCRNAGDTPMTLFLSVTPHLEPTHTMWDDNGNKLPPRYGTSTSQERATRSEPETPVVQQAARFTEAARALADVTTTSANAHASLLEDLQRATRNDDTRAAKSAVDAMWQRVHETCLAFQKMEIEWNELAPSVDKGEDQ